MKNTPESATTPEEQLPEFTSSRRATTPSPPLPPVPKIDHHNTVHHTLAKVANPARSKPYTLTEQRYPCPECKLQTGKLSRVGSNRRTCGTCNRYYQRFRRRLTRMAISLLTEEQLEVLDEGARELTYKEMFPEYADRHLKNPAHPNYSL